MSKFNRWWNRDAWKPAHESECVFLHTCTRVRVCFFICGGPEPLVFSHTVWSNYLCLSVCVCVCAAQLELYYTNTPGAQQCGLKGEKQQKAKDERERETVRLRERGTDGATALILVAQDCCLLAPFSFSNFCPPLMRTNLATRLYSCLFLSALCDTVMDSSHRAYLCLFLSPSLPSDLIRGQWAGKKQRGGWGVGAGSAIRGGGGQR